MTSVFWRRAALVGAVALSSPAHAGPPYLSDDPEPTPYRHFEIYAFGNGVGARGAVRGDAGIDFNYGATPDLQLTAVLPVSYERAEGGRVSTGLGNIELAAKVRFLHQESAGWNVALFPRVFLPSASGLASGHASLLLPVWLGKDAGSWSTFGGGGCVLNRGGGAHDYCLAGWTLARRVVRDLQVGAEVFHQGADSKGARASTIVGLGAAYDLSAQVHLLGYAGSGVQNVGETGRGSGYASILFTF
jgi:hypothetical protein